MRPLSSLHQELSDDDSEADFENPDVSKQDIGSKYSGDSSDDDIQRLMTLSGSMIRPQQM